MHMGWTLEGLTAALHTTFLSASRERLDERCETARRTGVRCLAGVVQMSTGRARRQIRWKPEMNENTWEAYGFL